jgi:hypothetical protein
MKPICKAEALWKYWREEGRSWRKRSANQKSTAWVKNQMQRARRRFLQHDLHEQGK